MNDGEYEDAPERKLPINTIKLSGGTEGRRRVPGEHSLTEECVFKSDELFQCRPQCLARKVNKLPPLFRFFSFEAY